MNVSRTSNILICIIAITFILVITKNYLLPFVIALIFWYFSKVARDSLRNIPFVRTRVPIWLQNSLVFAMFLVVIIVTSELVIGSIQQFSDNFPEYEKNIQKINTSIHHSLSIDIIGQVREYSGNIKLTDLIEPILNGVSSIIGNGVIIIIYIIFILLEESAIKDKFSHLFSDKETQAKADRIISKINRSFSNYILLKTFVSILTAILSYIALRIIGVNSPILWSFLIFLFNYIPNIGSPIATAFPVIIAMLQYGEVMPGIWVLISVGAIQFFVGSVIDPRIMGNSLNISPLVVIIALVAWGAIWGVVGMVLSVPITVMMIIIFAQFPSMRPVAIMLSQNGKV